MNNKFLHLYAILAILFLLYSFSSNPPNNLTGSPASNGQTCANCHGGGNFTGGVTITGLPASIMANMTYNITVSTSFASGTPSRAGFQLDAVGSAGTRVGNLSNPGPSSTVLGGLFEHSPALSFSGNSASWTVDWTAPSGSSGEVITLYAAAVIGNGSGSGGDQVVTTIASGTLVGAPSNILVDIISQSDVSCFGGNDGQATALASNGSGNYTYNWSNGGSGATVSNFSEGTYTVTATDNVGGATATAMVNIGQASQVTVNIIGSTNVDCNNSDGSATVLATGGTPDYNYTWSTGQFGANVNLPVGTHTVTATDNANCTGTTTITIIDNSNPPNVNAGSTQTIDCNNATVTLAGSGDTGNDISIQWNSTGGNILSGANTYNPIVDQAGTYTLTVTNNTNGCTNTSTVVVNEDTSAPTVSVTPSGTLNCNATTVTINTTVNVANATYQWTGPNSFSSSLANPTLNTAGSYSLLVTNTNNGCTTNANIDITEDSEPTVQITDKTDVDCNGGSTGTVTAVAAGGVGTLNYNWSSGGTTSMESNLSAGTYTLTVTDDNNCTVTTSVFIDEPAILAANLTGTNITAVGAMDGTAMANPTGGTPDYTYLWNTNATTQSIENLSPDSYFVTITDANNCTTTETIVISDFDCGNLSIEFTKMDVSCHQGNDGTATISVLNGTAPFSYAWSTGGMMATINNLAANTYIVTITDNNNCQVVGNVTINEPTAIVINVSTSTTPTCNGFNDGSITVSTSGGTGILTYAWNDIDMQTATTANNLTAGNYTLVVTDENGCTENEVIALDEPNAIDISITKTDETANAANNGIATVNVIGGTGDFSFLWNNDETTQTIENLAPGEYCVTVTDSNNCEIESCVMINAFGCNAIQTVVDTDAVDCFGAATGSATVSSFGGTAPYSYNWSNGITANEAMNLSAGTYTVTCTDANNCQGIIEVMVSEPNELNIEVINQGNVDCEGNDNGFISVNATGGILGYEYSWNTGATETTITDLVVGIYTCTVTDPNGCTASVSTEVILTPDLQAPTIIINDITVYLDENGIATIEPADIDAGSFDNCGIVSAEIDRTNFGCGDEGANPVIYAALDAAGNCGFDTTFVIVRDSLPPTINCPEDIVEIGCSGMIEYDTPTAMDNCALNTPFLFDGLPSGGMFPVGESIVTWGVTDQFGNPATCSFTVTLEADLSATTNFTPPTCNSFDDGAASVTAMNGVPPYVYQWDDVNMQTTETATDLIAGFYQVTITDDTGCSVIDTVTVEQPAPIVITIDTIMEEINETMNGSIDISVTGGIDGNFDFAWFFEDNLISDTEDLTGISLGEYVIVATDGNGCAATDTLFVNNIFVNSLQNELEESIKIAPNPSDGQGHVFFDLEETRMVSLAVFNLLGERIFKLPSELIKKDRMTLDFSGEVAGIYLIKIEVEDTILLKRLIVQ